MIKSRELELVAARNFLLPNLDLNGTYRWRGFGKTLFPDGNNLPTFDSRGVAQYDNAYADLTGGQHQEWQLGASSRCPWGSARDMRRCEMRKRRFAGHGPWSAKWSGRSFMT